MIRIFSQRFASQVDFSSCTELTDAAVQHMAALPALRTLILARCPRLTDTALRYLSASAPLHGPLSEPGKDLLLLRLIAHRHICIIDEQVEFVLCL